MGSELPGGARKPRTATPLAWRLLYLIIGAFAAWCFHSTRTTSVQIIAEVHATLAEISRVQGEVKALKEAQRTAVQDVVKAVGEALDGRLAKVTSHLDGLPEQLAQSVASDVRTALHKELAEVSGSLTPTIEGVLQKEIVALETKWEATTAKLAESVKSVVAEATAAHTAELERFGERLDAQAKATEASLAAQAATVKAEPIAKASQPTTAAVHVAAEAAEAAPAEAVPAEAAPAEAAQPAAVKSTDATDAAPDALDTAATAAAPVTGPAPGTGTAQMDGAVGGGSAPTEPALQHADVGTHADAQRTHAQVPAEAEAPPPKAIGHEEP